MAKQMLNIPSFKGGLNTALDPRDIKPSELSKANNVMFDINGIIRCQGKSTQHDLIDAEVDTISHGWGLFTYESSHGIGGVTPASVLAAPYDESEIITYHDLGYDDLMDGGYWYAISDDLGNIKIKEFSEASWSTDISTLESGGQTENAKTIYHIADEALRISNANIKSEYIHKNTWFGYIKETKFFAGATNTTDYHFNGWYALDNDIKKPTELDFLTGTTALTYPTGGTGFDIKVSSTTGGSLDFSEDIVSDELTYEFASTFIYDGIQESLPISIIDKDIQQSGTTDATTTDQDALEVEVTAKTGYNPRITGGRVYYKKHGSNDDWVFLCQVDFGKGIKASIDDEYTATWTESGGNETNASFASEKVKITTKPLDTYQSLTEWGARETRISIGCTGDNYPTELTGSKISEGYKCSAIVNRRAFIANCKLYHNESSGIASGDSKVEKDRIYYSGMCSRNGINFEAAFDCFPRSNYIDVIKGDAEEYTALVGYADRLLAFKDNTLFIINVAGTPAEWFLESQHSGMGVSRPCQIANTEDGVMWANKNGAYVYTGGEVRTKTTEDISFGADISNISRDKIRKNEWFGEDASMSVGYVPRYSQLFVISSTSNGNNSIGYIYDYKTGTWSSSSDNMILPLVGINGEITNFVTDNLTGNIMWASRADYATATELVVNGEFDQDVPDDTDGYMNLTFGAPEGTVDGYPIYDSDGESVSPNWAIVRLQVVQSSEPNTMFFISNQLNYYYEYTIPVNLVNGTNYLISMQGFRNAMVESVPYVDIVYQDSVVSTVFDTSDFLTINDYQDQEIPTMEAVFTAAGTGSHKIRFHASSGFGNVTWIFAITNLSVKIASDEAGDLKFYEFKNDNLIIGTPDSDSFDIPAGTIDIRTKDMDFGQTGLKKRVYAAYITYRSNAAQTAPVSYTVDGASAYNTNADNWTNLSGNMVNTNGEWKVAKFYPSTTFTCQSLRLKITNPTNDGIVEINDIAIEHRITGRKVA